MHLSILIPVYNAEKHIINCLESVVNQGISIEDYEVILINDGSTDTSGQVIRDYISDKPNMVLIDQNNQGNASTRNRMFDLAKGTYIYCLDADDYLVPKSLNKILEYALENRMDFVGFTSKITYSTDEESTVPENSDLNLSVSTGAGYLNQNVLPHVEVWWYIVSKNLLDRDKIRLENLVMADVPFTYRVVLGSKRMGILPIHAHWYFQSADSIMRSKGNISDHKRHLAESTYHMLLELNNIIVNPSSYNLSIDRGEMKDLIQKRDYYAFFMILKLLRFESDGEKTKKYINVLAERGMYPFHNPIKISKCPKLLEKLINSAINNKKMVFLAIWLSSMFRFTK